MIRYAGLPDLAWANGAGTTRTLWADPSAPGEFDRRIAIARLVGPAAFSMLPGIARTLLVIDSVAPTLRIDGVPVTLGPSRPGPVRRHVGRGAGRDRRPYRVLNVMTRCDRWSHGVTCGGAGSCFASVMLAAGIGEDGPFDCGDLLFADDRRAPEVQTARIRFLAGGR